ncbi:MAG: hypothetical protein LAT50_22345, partial [Ectothiorhodospiraceae bacterium]|nr:hypothetical protein [Ectothiorhodospiraceae bacterium]
LPDYEAIAEGIGFENVQPEDWSTAVAPFWDVVMYSALDTKVILGVLLSGWETIQGAVAMNLMLDGYKSGLVRYGVLSGRKPLEA